MDGFGDAKLGMTIREFNQRFNTQFRENEQFFDKEIDSMNVGESIILRKASFNFTNFKLTKITSSYDAKLFAYLRNYGIRQVVPEGTIFKTNDSIFCIAGIKKNQPPFIGIMDRKNDGS